MTTYPARIDTSVTLPKIVDNKTTASGVYTNNALDAIIAIESELGVKPSSTYGTVRTRLDTIENNLNNLQTIKIGGDIGGTLIVPLVIGIQGRPISSTAPLAGQVLTWNGAVWLPATPTGGGGGGGNITLGGDLGGSLTLQTVIGLQGRALSSMSPSLGQSILWNGAQWAPGNVMQDFVLPAFAITLTGGGIVEVGQTVTLPSFTATYNYSPVTASLTDTDGHSQSVIFSPTLFHSNYSFAKNTFGTVVTFTLTANDSFVTRTITATETWGQKIFWGVGAASQSGASFIQSLSGQQTTLTKNTSFTLNPNSSQKIYFAHRTAYGVATFSVGGIAGGFTQTSSTTSVTNGFGFTENYSLYESDNLGLGTITTTVT